MKIYLVCFLALGAALRAQTPEQKSRSAPEVYHDFLVAMVKADKAALAGLVLPNQEISVLVSAGPVPAEHYKTAMSVIDANPYRVLKVGEIFRLPNGRTVSLTEEMEQKGWTMVVSSRDPLPHMLQKTEAGWRVDANDLIASRKAAAQQKK